MIQESSDETVVSFVGWPVGAAEPVVDAPGVNEDVVTVGVIVIVTSELAAVERNMDGVIGDFEVVVAAENE